jgi:DNA adenine methylase
MSTTTTYRPVPGPLKWHGGKRYLAARILDLMPPHLHYVEPFAGGLAVLLAKDPEGVSEVVNDLDGQLTNFWRVIRSEELFGRFARQAQAVPFSRPEWEAAHAHVHDGRDPVADAVAFFVDCRQSRQGLRKDFATLVRTRTRRGMNDGASAWLSAVEGLPAVHARLRRVVVENLPAVRLIAREDRPATLFYCDPPYLHETRAEPDAYRLEMGEADHRELLDVLKGCEGKVILSGYPSGLYDEALSGWSRHTQDCQSGGKNWRLMKSPKSGTAREYFP